MAETLLIMALIGSLFMAAKVGAETRIKCASTTSTQNSGLFDYLLPIFEKKTGIKVDVVAVGTGAAIEIGKRGDADVVMVHAKELELKAVEEGWFKDRHDLMYNDFVIIGPTDDPLKIKGLKSDIEAFKKIAAAGSLFLSRGDNSGTHAKEKDIWKVAGVKYEGEKWYQQTGLGMGQTLNVAAEKKGYTLTDRGTYLALAKTLKLGILVEGDAVLLNIYHVMEVNSQKWPKVHIAAAKAFADFMVSKETQEIIKTYGVDKYGSPLFFPDAGKKVEDLGK